jgi:hypothetical protein
MILHPIRRHVNIFWVKLRRIAFVLTIPTDVGGKRNRHARIVGNLNKK